MKLSERLQKRRRRHKTIYTLEQRRAVLEQYLTGITVEELEKQLGIARGTIYRWIRDGKLGAYDDVIAGGQQ